jgi:hypothetical protein
MVTSERIVGTTASLWGSGVDDVWAVGGSGSIRHWDGSTWTPVASGTSSDLTGVSGHGAADVWAVGPAGTVVNWNGASWGSVAEGSIGPLSAVWGRAPDDVWTGGPLHWNGRAWTAPSDDSNIEALAFCGFSPGDVWAVGQDLVAGNGTGTIAHWDGASWTVEGIAGVSAPNATVLGPSEMRAVWCHSPSDVWAVGKITALTGPLVDTIARWDGSSWSPVDNPTAEPLTGIWGTDGNDIWAAGDQGALVHWDGSSWTPIQSATVADLGAVWGSGSEDVWVIAKGTGFMEHWDGRAWTLVSDGTTGATLLSLWGVLPGDVWAAGMLGTSAGGVVSHWDGRAWSTVWKVPGEVPRFTGIWGSAGEIFLVAENGMIFSRR